MVPASKSVEKLAETAAVYLGRSPTEKGVDRLAEALERIEPSHTSGPWTVVQHSDADCCIPAIHYAGGRELATCWNGYVQNIKQTQANANLIAAAPDLLEACKMLVDAERVHEQFRNDTSGGVNSTGIAAGLLLEIATKKARAAIAKAGGAL